MNTKGTVFEACIRSTILYGNKAWEDDLKGLDMGNIWVDNI